MSNPSQPSKITTQQAWNLFFIIKSLGGPSSFYTLFKAVQERINSVFPELTRTIPVGDPILTKKRDLPLSLEEKSALAYQFVELFEELNTDRRDALLNVAQSIGPRVAELVKNKLKKSELKTFSPSEIAEEFDKVHEPAARKAPKKK